ncbi:hypothetical protein [Salinivibrio phage CW02]|uniref:Uncharacterized protein n=1 Tax=Salinivibrio phage CW02 TaxID=1161935 RepID=H9D1E9_9CAUD|nr:hypothetical protein F490_gp46 [Salinivibrio phage CW02]AFE86191.1 hypothetical protein [Salinivibrio phage CW02]
MSLNVKKMKSQGGKKRVPQDELEVGNYLCRVAQVIDLGIHHREKWDTSQSKFVIDNDKAPAQKIMVTYEFGTVFVKDAEGNEEESKPRWLSEELYLYPLDVDLATSTKRYKAIDPKEAADGDWSLLVNAPCNVTIAHKKSGKAKIGAVTPAMAGIPYPEMKNEPKVLLIDQPDLEVFGSLPDWLQEKITSSLEFEGSALHAALNGGEVKSQGKDASTQNEGNELPESNESGSSDGEEKASSKGTSDEKQEQSTGSQAGNSEPDFDDDLPW